LLSTGKKFYHKFTLAGAPRAGPGAKTISTTIEALVFGEAVPHWRKKLVEGDEYLLSGFRLVDSTYNEVKTVTMHLGRGTLAEYVCAV
jgi:hypothetical protein